MSDIYGLLQGKTLADPSVLERFGPELGAVLAKKFADKQNERQPTLRMSSVGKPLKQLWYELNGYKAEEINGQAYLKFLYGDLIESLILVLAEASGHKVERLQEEISVDGVLGHIDAVIDGVLIDVKSASPYSYMKFENGTLFDSDVFGYQGQLCGYAKALNLPAAWIAINKVSGEICVLKLPQESIDEYDIRSRIELVRSTCSSEKPPERCYSDEPFQKSGNRKLGVGCSYCGWKTDCWKDSNNGEGLRKYIYSTGPVWLTSVIKEPNVFQENKSQSDATA